MNKFLRKAVPVVLAAVMLFTAVGCAGKQAEKSGGTGTTPTSAPAAKGSKITDKDITLSIWVALGANPASIIKSYGDMEAFKLLEEKTGIKIKWVHVPEAGQKDAFNIMIASNDLPDAIGYNWAAVDGGAKKFVDNGYILKLDDLVQQNAPNFLKVINSDEQIKKQIAAKGGFYTFDMVRTDPRMNMFQGFQIRKDWLDKLNLKVPATVEDWYTVLKAFKTNDMNGNGKADEIPFVANKLGNNQNYTRLFAGFGVGNTYYNDNGVVKYGPMQPAYKEALIYTKKLYDEGLLDPDSFTQDAKAMDNKVLSDLAGAWWGNAGGHLVKYIDAKKDDKNFKPIGVSIPTSSFASKPYFLDTKYSQPTLTASFAVTAKNKFPVETIKWFDYLYSQEGAFIVNFGKEGVSHTLDNNKNPVYTDDINKNPNFAYSVALFKHVPVNFPTLSDPRTFDLGQRPESLQAINTWSKEDDSRVIQQVALDSALNQKIAAITQPINDYVEEMTVKFILGKEPMDNFDKVFVPKIKQMNVEEVIKARQDAMDKYKALK